MNKAIADYRPLFSMHVYDVRPRNDKRGVAPESFLIAGW